LRAKPLENEKGESDVVLHRLLERWGRMMYRFRWAVLAVWLVRGRAWAGLYGREAWGRF